MVPIRHAPHQPDTYSRVVLPDTSPNLIWLWQPGLAAQEAPHWVELPQFSLSGLLTHKKEYHTSVQAKGLIIKLRPWTLGLLRQHVAVETTDQSIGFANNYPPDHASRLTTLPVDTLTCSFWLKPILEHFFSVKPIDQAVVKAIQTVQQCPSGLRIKALAEQANQCSRQFERRFKAATGLTPKQFVRNARFEQAQKRLALGHSVLDVTYACGYFDQTHFTQEFRRISGLTPKVFQQSNMSLFY